MRDFQQLAWDEMLAEDCRQLVRLAVREDLDFGQDWTTVSLVPAEAQGKATIVARHAGVIAGLHAAETVIEQMDARLRLTCHIDDGASVSAKTQVATFEGPAQSMLTAERPILNFIGHLSGVATMTRKYVDAIAGTKARLYDTRKTTPGWRRLEKYAVRCGGGFNHRTGLYDAVLIKDNHLAFGAGEEGRTHFTSAEAVAKAREFLKALPDTSSKNAIVEVEIDSIDDLASVLAAGPDIVLLDNMPLDELRACVAQRNAQAPTVELEASGGIQLETIRAVAETGVDRISSGALTHSAVWFDVALDWD